MVRPPGGSPHRSARRPRILAWRSVSDPATAGPDAVDAARLLDRAGVDLVILDQQAGTARLDPVPTLTAFARATRQLGLVAGSPVSDQPPFLLARALGTLDLVSHGRSAWLIGEDRPTLDVRDDTDRWQDAATASAPLWREVVAEHVDTACALWGSWEPDAVVIDRTTGRFVDHTKVRTVEARGRFFRTRGPLNNPAPPQGRPVLLGVSVPGQPLPSAAVDVVLVRAADVGEAVDLVGRVRADSPVVVLVSVTATLAGTAPGGPRPGEAASIGITGSAPVVAAELDRLLAMTGADGIVLHGALDVRTVAATVGALDQEWGAAEREDPQAAQRQLRDRLLAFAPSPSGTRAQEVGA